MNRTRIAGFALLTALALMLLVWPWRIVRSFLVLIPPFFLDFSVSAPAIAACYVLGVYVALILAEPRKRVVLYLRRFRSVSASELMGRSIDAGLGRQVRVVTLDDATFRPIEVPKTERRFSVFSAPVLTALGLLLFVAVAYYVVIRSLQRSAPRPIPLPLWGIYLIAFGQSILQAPVWPAISGFVLLVFTFLLVHRWRVRRRARIRVRTRRDLDRCIQLVSGLASWTRRPGLLAPQATVIKVVDELWQAAVVGLLDYVDAAIIDVSAVSENVLWEVRTLKARNFERYVWIGDAGVVAAWHNSEDPLISTLITLIGQDKIATYDPQVSGAERHLRSDVIAAMECLKSREPRRGLVAHTGPLPWQSVRAGLMSLILYGTTALLVCALNLVLWEVGQWCFFWAVTRLSRGAT